MIILIIALVAFLLSKLANINIFNISILLFLMSLWIISGIFGVSIIKNGGSWKWPILMGVGQLTQSITRVPMGKFSQKIRSRKTPITLMFLALMLLSLPLMFTVNYTTLLLAAIGLGAFSGTFGMQNQYWSENWDIRNVLITSGLIFSISYLGRYVGNIIDYSTTIDENMIKWLISSAFIAGTIALAIYWFFHKEDRSKIHLDNQSGYAKEITPMTLRHVIVFAALVVFISFAINMVSSNIFVQTNSKTLSAVLMTTSLVSGVMTALIFVRFIDIRIINWTSHIVMLVGFSLIAVSIFAIHSPTFSFFGIAIATSGAAIYTMAIFGVALHVDHKNSLLVLGIWLSIKSFFISQGQMTRGFIEEYISYDSMRYAVIGAIVLTVVSALFMVVVYKKYTRPAFNLIDKLEKYNINKVNYPHWK